MKDDNTTTTEPITEDIGNWTPPDNTVSSQKPPHAARIKEHATPQAGSEPQQPTEATTAVKQNNPLTPKQAAFIRHIVDDKLTKTDAYIKAYNSKGKRTTAHVEANRTLRKPQVRVELAKHTDNMKLLLLDLAETSARFSRTGTKEGAAYAGVAERTINSVIDRVEGKSTQRTEVTTKAVTLNIDLTATTEHDL